MFQPTTGWMRLSVRCFSAAVLLVLSITIANLSSHSGFAGEEPNRDAETQKAPKSERAPFDLTYLPPDAMGVVAIRPSAIFSDPAMKPLADMANKGLAQLRQFLKLSGEAKLSIEDIEEISGNLTIKPGDKTHGRNHSLLAGLTMIRTKQDFDWAKLMRQLDPKAEEVRQNDRLYYRSHFAKIFGESLGAFPPKATFCYFMPDERTIAFLQEKTLSAFVKGQSIQRPHFSWDENWKRVDHGLIAVAIDNRWAKGLSKEQIGGEPELIPLAQNAATMVAGVDWKDGIDFNAYLTGKDSVASAQLMKNVKDLITNVRHDLEKPPADDYPAAAIPMVKAFWKNVRVSARESTVCVHSKAKVNLADLVKCFFQQVTFQPK